MQMGGTIAIPVKTTTKECCKSTKVLAINAATQAKHESFLSCITRWSERSTTRCAAPMRMRAMTATMPIAVLAVPSLP
eukprot:CAMPEP_0182842224 /NCGR_PEP_ID=MMETSP0006_2-20121128/25502_1 /TAXON_ID=97485 /ORGANISM="Prymnesium parvum, Strain Texoma1" /LENGTH=77 /DNA_ID=CAMNT_0024971859 /DNA_START=74 /DNA_END=307 /DNA_ORIENTATION=-